MEQVDLGKVYKDTEVIIKQGEYGDSIYVIQEGLVEIVYETDQSEVQLDLLYPGDMFGEMAVIDREVQSATARAIGDARILTIDKKNFMRRISEDPSLAFNLVRTMAARIRRLSRDVSLLNSKLEK